MIAYTNYTNYYYDIRASFFGATMNFTNYYVDEPA